VAKRNTPRRGRSRKRRAGQSAAQSGSQASTASPVLAPAPKAKGPSRPANPRAQKRDVGRLAELQAVGERPNAPWHPWPLSELLILVGAIGAIVGVSRGPEANRSTIIAGVLAVVLGTVEVSLREHLSGYRSHTLMLALLPAIALHTAVILTVAALTRVPRLLNLGLLILDGAIVWFLFKLLRTRFLDARRERMFEAGR
jgi:hypothetical protein